MSSQQHREEEDEPVTSRFRRNRYFNGKLMTAVDMQVEQEYHRARLHEMARHVLGTGLVYGLKTEVTEREEQLYADVEPGMGLDRHGRQVVVDGGDEIAIKRAEPEEDEQSFYDGDEIFLFLNYRECQVDRVPAPGTRNACEERCYYNHVVEDFEVVYTEERPERFKEVPKVDFPTKDDLDVSNDDPHPYDPALMEMARSYYEEEKEEEYEPNTVHCEFDHDCSLFLGQFQKREDERESAWHFLESSDRRPFVYTNDMLYAIVARHVTDFGNPHEVEEGLRTIENVSNPEEQYIDFHSPDGTIHIEGIDDKDRVDFDVTEKVARTNDLNPLEKRIEDLEECVDDLKECVRELVVSLEQNVDVKLGDECDRLFDDEERPKQEQRQERQEDDDDVDVE